VPQGLPLRSPRARCACPRRGAWARMCHAAARAGVLRFPVAAKVEADNLSARFGGWRTSTGVLLRQPLASTINFTPALAKCAPRVFMVGFLTDPIARRRPSTSRPRSQSARARTLRARARPGGCVGRVSNTFDSKAIAAPETKRHASREDQGPAAGPNRVLTRGVRGVNGARVCGLVACACLLRRMGPAAACIRSPCAASPAAAAAPACAHAPVRGSSILQQSQWPRA
jgi:hypothetical protein